MQALLKYLCNNDLFRKGGDFVGSIFKSGASWKIRFDVDTPDGHRKQKQIGGFKTKRDAQNKLDEIQKTSTDVYNTDDISLNQFLDIWMRNHGEISLTPKFVIYYKNIVDKHLKPYFKNIKNAEMVNFSLQIVIHIIHCKMVNLLITL